MPLVGLLLEDFTVLCFLDLGHVFHAAVKIFDSISVQNRTEWVVPRERVLDQLKVFGSNVSSWFKGGLKKMMSL